MSVIAGLSAGPALAGADVTVQELSRIKAAVANLNCRINDMDIKKQGDGYIITDAFCADGQFAIRINADFQVVDKRSE